MGLLNLANSKGVSTQNNGGRNPKKTLYPITNKKISFVILDDDFIVEVPSHYLINKHGGVFVACLGPRCPVCKRNEEIKAAHPEDYRNHSGYRPVNYQIGILVFDITEYRYCSDCGAENFIDEKVCYQCKSKNLGKPEPANVLKTLILSSSQARALAVSVKEFINRSAEVYKRLVKFGDFFTDAVKVKEGGKKSIVNFSNYLFINEEDKPDIPEVDFDPEIMAKYVVRHFTEEEIVNIMSGMSLKEIYEMRASKREEPIDDAKDEVQQAVESLFSEE